MNAVDRHNMRRIVGCLLAAASLLTAPSARAQSAPPPSDSTVRVRDSVPLPHSRLRLLPVLSRAPETGIGVGVALVNVRRIAGDTTTRPSTIDAVIAVTQKHYAKFLLESERWTRGNQWRLYESLAIDRAPLPYYGVLLGAHVPVEPTAFYTTDTFGVVVTADRQIGHGVYLGLGFRSTADHAVASRPDTLTSSTPGVSSRGGRVTGVEETITYDTRDNIYGARHGAYLQLQHFNAAQITGSEFTVERLKIDGRAFFPIRSEHVLALQAQYETLAGAAPFEELPTIGGSLIMRGYVPGQFRDRNTTSAQAELRIRLAGRFGIATWTGAALVCGLRCSATWHDLLPTNGVGLRYYLVPAERLTVRVDFGVGRHSNGLYFDFTEAF